MGLYDIVVRDNQGIDVALSEYKGKVLLIVNTATKCGHTKQYEALQNIYVKYKDRGFEILDFPCNKFFNQAPGDAQTIAQFCQGKFGITFRQFEKINVNGKQASPLYEFLREQEKEGVFKKGRITWNFAKFLVDRQGQVVGRFDPKTKPEDIVEDIEKLL